MQKTIWIALFLLATPLAAQQSASFDLEGSILNSGGSPADGVAPSSPSFRIGLDAIGGAARIELSGPSFSLEGGFVAAYRPPLEVTGLRFSDGDRLDWDPEPSAGHYALYRGLIGEIPLLGYGSCFIDEIVSTGVDVPTLPPLNFGFFYLVTANNRLHQEGSKGFSSNGSQRPNPSPCP